ncbi:MAG: alpha/beta hydrolase, partial [Actinobacteria bacterium]|nr:alpha/beta hydrolase [Actinomycetota bacterium]
EPEDLMVLDVPALVIPGRDTSHATSAARYLEECLPRATYWDAPPSEQTAGSVAEQVLGFLGGIDR